MSGSTFKWYPGVRAALDRAMAQAVTMTAEDIARDVDTRGVVPHAESARKEGHTAGALASSVAVEAAKGKRARIMWTFPGAARVYFHPEWNFSQAVHGNARGAWMEDYIDGERTAFVRDRYRRNLGAIGVLR